LSLYLLTFVLAFESDRWYPRLPFAIAAGVLAPAACALVNAGVGVALWVQLAGYLAALFVLCMVCHGENFISTRPGTLGAWTARIDRMMGAQLATKPAASGPKRAEVAGSSPRSTCGA